MRVKRLLGVALVLLLVVMAVACPALAAQSGWIYKSQWDGLLIKEEYIEGKYISFTDGRFTTSGTGVSAYLKGYIGGEEKYLKIAHAADYVYAKEEVMSYLAGLDPDPAASDAPYADMPDGQIGLLEDTDGNTYVAPGDYVSLNGNEYKRGADGGMHTLKLVAQFVLGACAAVCIVFFGKSVLNLNVGALSGHPKERKSAIMGVLYSGIGIILFGGLTLLVSFAWNFFSVV